MQEGLIFDIKEFALNDGPGVRLTVFFKGCPLKCLWCHNPEGISDEIELNLKTRQLTGKYYTSEKLIEHIKGFKEIYDISGGGVSFSGGEPTAQAEFLLEVLTGLEGVHRTLDTCGYCESSVFNSIINNVELVYFDYKLGDSSNHIEYTGKSNDCILKNLKLLADSGKDYVIRVPLIPGITDTKENLDLLLEILKTLPNLPERIDLLPYNKLAGGKYENYGLSYPLSGINIDNNEANIRDFKKNVEEYRLCKNV